MVNTVMIYGHASATAHFGVEQQQRGYVHQSCSIVLTLISLELAMH